MSVLEDVLPWKSVVDGVLTEINKFLPDPQAKAAAQMQVLQMQQAGVFKQIDADVSIALAQSNTNAIEAASTNLFKSGWRPFIGWVCGLGLAYQFLGRPILVGITAHDWPSLDMGTLLTLLGGMLGLGTLRTTEKLKGVA